MIFGLEETVIAVSILILGISYVIFNALIPKKVGSVFLLLVLGAILIFVGTTQNVIYCGFTPSTCGFMDIFCYLGWTAGQVVSGATLPACIMLKTGLMGVGFVSIVMGIWRLFK